MEFADPFYGHLKFLPTQHYNVYLPVSVYFKSDVGADNYVVLSYSTHSDEWQKNMVTVQFQDYETIPGIRARRGY